ncbi:hypothetical protein IG631_17113 [Alternaria alternata]|nr:hypothetical protein IG631_17113 [Alternaria alternata]
MIQIQREHELDQGRFEGGPTQNVGKPIGLIRKKDNKQLYAMRRVKRTELVVLSPTAKYIYHPFIAHLAFTEEILNNLYLYSPFISGGHLLNHVQKVRHFDADTSRLYAAEFVCGLEYLYSLDVCCWLKAGNIMLDSLGHITLCGFGLFRQRDGIHTDWKRPEYPAPEVLTGDKYSTAADWWTLGVVLYEMLTGLPPFYSNALGNIRDNIISKPLHLPRSMHANAKNIMSRLLDRDPDQRLGADVNGASEVGQHAFFKDLGWQEVIERKTEPSFRPGYHAGAFGSYGVDYPHTVEFGQLEEPLTTRIVFGFGARSVSEPGINAIDVRTGASMFGSIEENVNTIIDTDESMNLDTAEQLRTALEVALQSDQQDRVAHLLELEIDLDTPIFQHTSQRSTMLTWVMSHRSLSMLIVILSKVDVKSRHRVSATRALGLAIKMRNTPAAKILLEHGTRCDFEDGDIPIPADVDDPDGDTFDDPLVLGQFTPALVYAALNHDAAMARILLNRGANPNLGYHGIHRGMRSAFSCGRIVELAMDLRFVEMVQMLLDHGADIGRAPPVWYAQGHECEFVPRSVYQRVMAALRAIQSESLEE